MKNLGFTLVEVLTTVVIMAILAGISSGVYRASIEPARQAKVAEALRQECRAMITACIADEGVGCDFACYAEVEIGSQTWISTNMNEGGLNLTMPMLADGSEKWCYNNNEDTCTLYGAMYSWEAAQNVCPNGYRLPTRADFSTLYAAAGGNTTNLKEGGTSGFNAPLSGQIYPGMSFIEFGVNAYFWTADPYYARRMWSGTTLATASYHSATDFGASVRCIAE